MEKKLPDDITWRRDKTGFEAPQQAWMNHKQVQEMIVEAKRKLVNEKILDAKAMNKPVQASGAYEDASFDWRYFSAASSLWQL
jgi:asparagine synthase (glutamine-hydrolysing)